MPSYPLALLYKKQLAAQACHHAAPLVLFLTTPARRHRQVEPPQTRNLFRMLDTLAQAAPDLAPIDKYGFAGLGILLVGYLLWQHRQVMERVAPVLERTSQVLERCARLLDDLERDRKGS